MLMMIFMNFIIAVISDTYQQVSKRYVAHDYHQRAIMIYEREVHFTQDDSQNEFYFPNIIIIRKKTNRGVYPKYPGIRNKKIPPNPDSQSFFPTLLNIGFDINEMPEIHF